jgi:hypothetical protein
MQAAIPFLKIVGGVLAAKTAIDGIREGNWGKAILGGVGAYFSFAGVAAGAAGTTTSNAAAAGAPAVAQASQVGGGSFYGAVAPELSAAGAGAASGFSTQAGLTNLANITPINSTVQAGLGGGGVLSGAAMGATSATAPTAMGGSGGLLGSGGMSVGTSPMATGTTPMATGTPSIGAASSADPAGLALESTQKGGFNISSLGDVKRWAEANPELAAATMQMGGQAVAGYADATLRARELQRILDERARERSSRGAVADVNYDLR